MQNGKKFKVNKKPVQRNAKGRKLNSELDFSHFTTSQSATCATPWIIHLIFYSVRKCPRFKAYLPGAGVALIMKAAPLW